MNTHPTGIKKFIHEWINEITTELSFGIGIIAGILLTLSGHLAGGATIAAYLIGTLTTVGYYGYECYYGSLIHEFDSTIIPSTTISTLGKYRNGQPMY